MRRRALPLLLAPLLGLLVTACAGRRGACLLPTEAVPPADLPAAFSDSGAAPSRSRWWTAFHDPVLDRLVDAALADNPGLDAARERVVRAAALARRAGAPLLPQLDATASAAGASTRREVGGVRSTDTTEALALGAAASYEVDLWGRLRAERGALQWEACARQSDLDAARLTIAALVATTWYRFVEESIIVSLLQEQIETNEKLLSLIEARFHQGKAPAADVLRQQQLVERTRGNHSRSAARRDVFAHQLAALRGRPATDPPPTAPDALVALPPLPATGVPAATLQRRPDVQGAWRLVLSADRQLAASVADCYPRVELSASAVLGGAGFELLFIDRIARLAADLALPILDGGRRRAQVDADAATKRERLFSYREVVLVALQEVEDALAQERREREFLASLTRQHELAVQVVDTLLGRYGQGAAAYLDVLAAIQSEQSLTLSLVSARRQLVEYRVALCRAIAGAWCPAPHCARPCPEGDNPPLGDPRDASPCR